MRARPFISITMNRCLLRYVFTVALAPAATCNVFTQDTAAIHVSTLYDKMDAGDDADVVEPRRKLVRFNEHKWKSFSIKIGGGFLEDAATYVQDNNSKAQFDLHSNTKLRDLRFTFKGRLGRTSARHQVTYSMGLMYDKPAKTWLLRETGLMVVIPEIWGNVFIGRTKEGFSMNKVMVGYAGWTMERSSMSDATIPLLGDGIKWLGHLRGPNILWNIGYFFDEFNQDQAFSSYDHQVVARLMWLPILSEEKKTVFHIGINLRQGQVDGDTLQLRARPEAWIAPYFVDTKKFHAHSTFMYGGEVYYRKGPLMFGTEYWFESIHSPDNGNPIMHGGDIMTSWMITGETREYNTVGGFFKGILPDRTIFDGGIGAIEAAVRLSYIDLDDAAITGGKFWRITPIVNWHLSDNIRLEFAYGYGQLDRFNIKGKTQFFQTRLQLQL